MTASGGAPAERFLLDAPHQGGLLGYRLGVSSARAAQRAEQIADAGAGQAQGLLGLAVGAHAIRRERVELTLGPPGQPLLHRSAAMPRRPGIGDLHIAVTQPAQRVLLEVGPHLLAGQRHGHRRVVCNCSHSDFLSL